MQTIQDDKVAEAKDNVAPPPSSSSDNKAERGTEPPLASLGAPRAALTSSKVLVRKSTHTMQFFLDAHNLDEETAKILKEYDVDGDGIFTKEEVVSLVIELRNRSRDNAELRQWNMFYRKMTITMAILFVVLLLGFLGLSVAVTVMTARVDVNSEGVAVSASDPTIVIAVNDRATTYDIDYSLNDGALFCISDDTAESIISTATTTGKKVSLALSAEPGNDEQVVDLHYSTAVVDRASGQMTFEVAGQTLQMQTNEACGTATGGERRIGVTWL